MMMRIERETVTLKWGPRYIREAASLLVAVKLRQALTVPRQTVTEFPHSTPETNDVCTAVMMENLGPT